jgi:Zn-dependent peptidase ImmA (M78 family)/transcriptional regulator with XRE-family HTH domain
MWSRVALGNSQSTLYDEGVETEIGARVRARMNDVLKGVPQAEVAKRIGIPADAFSRSLNGKRAFTAVELVELAGLLQTSAHWFVTGEPDPFAVRYAGRHTFDHDSKTHLPIDWDIEHRALSDVALAYTQVPDLDERSERPRAATATEARELLMASGGPNFVRDLADVVEGTFGIDVVRIREAQRGFALEIGAQPVIVIEETPNWFRENWSIGHELAHVLGGDLSELGDTACDDPRAERRANAFAAELLLPSSVMTALDWKSAGMTEVAEFVWANGVSTEALTNRLAALKIAAGADALEAAGMKTQALLRRAGVPSDPETLTRRVQDAAQRRFPSRLIDAHRTAVSEGSLGPATLAWMLGVSPESIEDELAPTLSEPDIDWLGKELGLTE